MKIRATRENLFLMFIFGVIILALLCSGDIELFPVFTLGVSCAGFLFGKMAVGNSLSFSMLTVPATFMFAYFVVLGVPSIFMFEQMSHPIRYDFILAIHSVLFLFPLGVYLCDVFYPRSEQIIDKFFATELEDIPGKDEFVGLIPLAVISSVGIVALYFCYSQYVPLWEMIKQYPTPVEAVTLRFASNDSPLVVQFLFEFLRRMLLPTCVLFAYFRSQLPGGRWRRTYWFLLAYTISVSLLTLDRAPVFALVVMLVLGRALARNWSLRSAITSVHAVKWVPILGVLGGFISILQYQSDILWDTFIYNAWYVLSHRIFIDPSYMAGHYGFERFDDYDQLLRGRDIRLFSFFGGTYVDSVNGFGDKRNTVAPVSFVGDLWRNWGWGGVILGVIALGILIQFIQLRLCRRKNPMSMSLFVILILATLYMIPGGAFGVMTTASFLSILAITMFNSSPKPSKSIPLAGDSCGHIEKLQV